MLINGEYVKEHDIARCRCCGRNAPMKVVQPTFTASPHIKHNLPDLTGWMVIDYPFIDPRQTNNPGGYGANHTQFKEKHKVCPRCAKEVMGTLIHLSTP